MFRSSRGRFAILTSLFFILCIALRAQDAAGAASANAKGDAQAKGARVAPDAGQFQQALNEGGALFKGGAADDQAEAKLQEINTATPNSAQWHIESAMNLLRVAFACKESNDQATAQRVAARVLIQLEKAEKLFAGDAASLSSVYEIRGVVRERLLGNTTQALECYREAVRQKPDNASAKRRTQLLQGATQDAQK